MHQSKLMILIPIFKNVSGVFLSISQMFIMQDEYHEADLEGAVLGGLASGLGFLPAGSSSQDPLLGPR